MCSFSRFQIWLQMCTFRFEEAVSQLVLTPKIFLLFRFRASSAFLFRQILNCWTASEVQKSKSLLGTPFFRVLLCIVQLKTRNHHEVVLLGYKPPMYKHSDQIYSEKEKHQQHCSPYVKSHHWRFHRLFFLNRR